MFFNLIFDSSVSSAPAGFTSTINTVATFLDNLFPNSTTVNVEVGYGEIAGMSLGNGVLGESETLYDTAVSYGQLAAALQAQHAPGSTILPGTAPTNKALHVAQAEEKALGLLEPSASIDGYVGFATSPFDYNRNDGITAGTYDFYAVVAHELTEVMGRISGLDESGVYSPMDLFRYAGSGIRQLTTGGPAYFSIDNGATNLGSWNTSPSGDLGDWATTVGPNSFDAFAATGVLEPISSADATLMDAIGWGDARFQAVVAWDLSWHVIATGDFNHDGTSDVIWDNGNGVEGGWLMANSARAGSLQLPYFPDWTTVASGDFNGDGNTDIMWQNSNGLVAEWFMGSGTRQGTAVIQNMAGWHVIATGDFNHDGISDVIWDNGAGVEGGWLMDRNGQIAGTLQLPFFPNWSVVATGDFNGDGNTDIMWQAPNGLVAEWFMGSGTRQGTQALLNMSGSSVIATGDFNHDDITDVMWRDAAGSTSAWLMNSNGLIGQTVSYGNTSGYNVVATGDYNNDGYGDVMWENSVTAAVTVWDFTTAAQVQTLAPRNSGGGPTTTFGASAPAITPPALSAAPAAVVSTEVFDPALLAQQMAAMGGASSSAVDGSSYRDQTSTTATVALLASPHIG